MHNLLKLFLALAVCTGFVEHVFSQEILRLPFNKKISTNEGLSSYNVKKVVQDKYGFIWIVTQEGLDRYDGRKFLLYNKTTDRNHQLLESDVWDVEEDSLRNILWVITAYGGINGIDLTTQDICFELRLNEKTPFVNNWLRCLKLYKNNLWIGTYDGLAIYNIDTKSFEQFEKIPFFKKPHSNFCVDKLLIDEHDNAWVFVANYGIVVYSCKTKKVVYSFSLQDLSLKYAPTYQQFNAVVFSQGELFAATDQGFRRFKFTADGKMHAFTGLAPGNAAFSNINIKALNIDKYGNAWFSTASMLFKFDHADQKIVQIKDADVSIYNDWLTNIYNIFFDNANHIWLGTQKGVTYTGNAIPAFTSYYVSEDKRSRIDHALYLYPHNDSLVYACTETGLSKINTQKNEIVYLSNGRSFYFMTQHKDGNLLASDQNGFFTYQQKSNRFYDISKTYPELKPINAMTVNSIAYSGDSLAVIGMETGNGFFSWNYKKKILKKIALASNGQPATEIVNMCYTDKAGRIWVLGDKLITLYDPTTGTARNISLTNYTNKTPVTLFFDVCEAGGYFWIAAYGTGLLQLDKNFSIKRIFSVHDGLCNPGVYKIFPVADSLIFITTNNGLSVLNLHTKIFNNYYQEDGLHSNSFEEGCGMYRDGKIYAGGVDGFTVIDPENLKTNTIPPSLYIDDVRIETGSGIKEIRNVLTSSIKVPDNTLQTSLSFSALNYSDPLRTSFMYKIKELNNNWIKLGTQNLVTIMGLGPGKYTLLVKSANENNVWNNTPLQLTLVYLPKWYQTLLFKLLLGIAMAALLYSFYIYRITQLKKQQKIRKDISADLHDDMGGILEGIKNFIHLAKQEPGKQEHLYNIEESLKQATAGFRDTIWILDDNEDSVGQFAARIEKFAYPLTNANNIQFECILEPGTAEKTLSKAEKRHLLLIVKEAITNSIKHASCKVISITIRQAENKLLLEIADDGVGYESAQKTTGNGLKNIIYRAAQIQYKIAITSSAATGTLIDISKK